MKFSNISKLLLASAVLATSAFATDEESGLVVIGQDRVVDDISITLVDPEKLSTTEADNGHILDSRLQVSDGAEIGVGTKVFIDPKGIASIDTDGIMYNYGYIQMTYDKQTAVGVFEKDKGAIEQKTGQIQERVLSTIATEGDGGVDVEDVLYRYTLTVADGSSITIYNAEPYCQDLEQSESSDWYQIATIGGGTTKQTLWKKYTDTPEDYNLVPAYIDGTAVIKITGIDKFSLMPQGSKHTQDAIQTYTNRTDCLLNVQIATAGFRVLGEGQEINPPIHTDIATIQLENGEVFAEGFEVKQINGVKMFNFETPETNRAQQAVKNYLEKFGIELDDETDISYKGSKTDIEVISSLDEQQAILIGKEISTGTDKYKTYQIKTNMHNMNALQEAEYIDGSAFKGEGKLQLEGNNRELYEANFECPVSINGTTAIPTSAAFEKALTILADKGGEIQNGSKVIVKDDLTIFGKLKASGKLTIE